MCGPADAIRAEDLFQVVDNPATVYAQLKPGRNDQRTNTFVADTVRWLFLAELRVKPLLCGVRTRSRSPLMLCSGGHDTDSFAQGLWHMT